MSQRIAGGGEYITEGQTAEWSRSQQTRKNTTFRLVRGNDNFDWQFRSRLNKPVYTGEYPSWSPVKNNF